MTKKLKIRIPKLSNDIAYLYGVIIGDGTVIMSKRKRGGYHYIIRITSDSKKYLNYLNELFYSLFNYKGVIEKEKRRKHAFYLIIQSAVLFWYFINLGMNWRKKRFLSVLHWSKNNDEFFIHYLSGLTDTDGYVRKSRIQLKQKSKKLLEEIFFVLEKLDMNPNPPKVNYTNSKPFYYIRFDNKLPLRGPDSSVGRATDFIKKVETCS